MRTNLNQPQPLNQSQSAPRSNFDFRQHRRGRWGGGYGRRPFRQVIKVSEPVISQNPDFNSTEIRFPNAPSEAMRKDMGKEGKQWEWSPWNFCWYKRNYAVTAGGQMDRTAENLAEAQEFVQRFLTEMNTENVEAIQASEICS